MPSCDGIERKTARCRYEGTIAMSEKIGILGAGGQADETESYLTDSEVDFYALSEQYVDRENERQINIVSPTDYQRMLPVVAAIGAPAIRKALVEQWPGEKYATVRADMSYVDKSAEIGAGSIIAPRSVITTNVKIGEHCIVNVAATVSHDCKIGDFVTISPGAHIAGHVELGDGVFVGIGAIISNNIKIAPGVVIGAGAVVIRDVEEENSVLVGTPAKVIKHNGGWLRAV